MIARTEIINAHAEGQLDSFDMLGVEEVGVVAEWATAGDDRVCEECASIEGELFTVDEARGMIPLHPNCRCAWIPAEKAAKKQAKPTPPPPPPPNQLGFTGIESGAGVPGQKYEVLKESIGGTTGAKLVDVNKISYVMKRYGNIADPEKHAQNEFIANRLLRKFQTTGGGVTPKSYLAQVKGKTAVFNQYIDDLEIVGEAFKGKPLPSWIRTKASKDFVNHAWLGNWDVAGLNLDNVAIHGKTLYYLDNGGALIYRAQGTLKGVKWTANTVDELSTMLNKSINPSSAKLFRVTETKLVKLIDDFEGTFKDSGGWDAVRAILRESGQEYAAREELYSTLFHRYNAILKHRDELKIKLAAKKLTAVKLPKGKVAETREELLSYSRKVSMPDNQRNAIQGFTGSNYRTYNQEALSGRATSRVTRLDAALEKAPRFKGLSFRGVSNYDQSGVRFDQWKTGQWARVNWKGYSSTSIRPGGAFGSHDGVMFIVKNNGKYGGYIERWSHHKTEMELLMSRDSSFKVVGYFDGRPSGTYANFGRGAHKRVLIIEEVDNIPMSQLAPKEYTAQEIKDLVEQGSAIIDR
jgi:hypothetical protein